MIILGGVYLMGHNSFSYPSGHTKFVPLHNKSSIANFIRYRNNIKDMTYILGAKCKDGVIIISDSRVSRGHEVNWDLKTFSPIKNTIVSAAGTTGVFQKFLSQINDYVESNQIKSWDELIVVVEDIVLKLNQRYYERTHGETIEVLIGFKKSEELAELYHVTSEGVSEKITNFIAIGHGEPYGSLFLKTIWNFDMSMKQTAELGAFIIKVITQLGLDNSVDDMPQVGYIPFNGEPYFSSSDEISELMKDADVNYQKFDSMLSYLLRSKKQEQLEQHN